LHKQLAQATEEIATREKEIRVLHDKLAANKAKQINSENEGEGESEGGRGKEKEKDKRNEEEEEERESGLKSYQMRSTWVTPYVDAWVRRAGPDHYSTRYWWGAVFVFLFLLVLRMWTVRS
jgi:hypothetical protein